MKRQRSEKRPGPSDGDFQASFDNSALMAG